MKRTALTAVFGAALCTVAALIILLAGVVEAQLLYGRLVHRQSTLYHEIFVYQNGSVMTLQFGRQRADLVQSQVDVASPRRLMVEYSMLMLSGLLYQPDPERILVVGLGGGVLPRELHHHFPDALVDVAEIDPEILAVAQQYFGFRTDERLRVHIGDGRVFIHRQGRKVPLERYDLIVLDAFNADYIPFHLMTREFLEEVKAVLADDGVVVANVFSDNRLCDAELKTFAAVFGRCQVFMGVESTNAMIVSPGSEAPILTVEDALAQAEELRRKHTFAFDLRAVARRLRPDVLPDPRAPVLTDDKAPVNRLREQETSRAPAR